MQMLPDKDNEQNVFVPFWQVLAYTVVMLTIGAAGAALVFSYLNH